MDYLIENVNESSKEETVDFLKRHENSSMSTLESLEVDGYRLTESFNSSNLKIIRQEGEIKGVFCFSRRGLLHATSEIDDPRLFELIWNTCRQEPITLCGLFGEWGLCKSLWDFLVEKKAIQRETYTAKEVLYTLDMLDQNPPSSPNVRLLTSADTEQWLSLRLAYLREQGIPSSLTQEQRKEDFLRKAGRNSSWGFFEGERLVSIAEFTAKAGDVGQVGGVFTGAAFRRKGYSKALMLHLIRDAKNLHRLRKLVIFTDENNSPARSLYESLGVKNVGYFAVLFGSAAISPLNCKTPLPGLAHTLP